jgi:hypothetical protein
VATSLATVSPNNRAFSRSTMSSLIRA